MWPADAFVETETAEQPEARRQSLLEMMPFIGGGREHGEGERDRLGSWTGRLTIHVTSRTEGRGRHQASADTTSRYASMSAGRSSAGVLPSLTTTTSRSGTTAISWPSYPCAAKVPYASSHTHQWAP